MPTFGSWDQPGHVQSSPCLMLSISIKQAKENPGSLRQRPSILTPHCFFLVEATELHLNLSHTPPACAVGLSVRQTKLPSLGQARSFGTTHTHYCTPCTVPSCTVLPQKAWYRHASSVCRRWCSLQFCPSLLSTSAWCGGTISSLTRAPRTYHTWERSGVQGADGVQGVCEEEHSAERVKEEKEKKEGKRNVGPKTTLFAVCIVLLLACLLALLACLKYCVSSADDGCTRP